MQKYYVVKLSKKDSKPKIILSDLINISKEVLADLDTLKEYNISIIKNIEYSVGDIIKTGTITHMEKFDSDIHVTLHKNDEDHVIVLPISMLKKTLKYDVHVVGKIIDTIKCEKMTKDIYLSTDKATKYLKLDDGTILVKKYKNVQI